MQRKERACCFIGAEVLYGEDLVALMGQAVIEMEQLIKQGINTFYSGAMPGFDLLCASAVVELQKQRHGITLVFLPPCGHWEQFLHGTWRSLYQQLLPFANRVSYTVNPRTDNCIRKRNERMIKRSEAVLTHCPHTWDMGWNLIQDCDTDVIKI